MDYPASLLPLTEELIVLPLGMTVRVRRSMFTLIPCTGRSVRRPGPLRTYVLDERGQPGPVEEVILRKCESDGWSGAVIEEFGYRLRSSNGEPARLPKAHAGLVAGMFSGAVSRLGCFNLLLWRGGRILGAYATSNMRSRLRTAQLRWISLSLDAGLPEDALLVIEWRPGPAHDFSSLSS
jgi:hypothetical protein